ncbi:MAG: flavohemoglobin expression-modulating motif protein [Rickettsiales bacterium]|jgi:uncharacterized protein (TIGR02421 family)|nr:flavohemoglobin expression-modulating motif protein [Rickettsiales bacterium]
MIDHAYIRQLDGTLVSIVRDFLILGPLSWSLEAQREFLSSVEKGNPVLPKVTYPKKQYAEKIAALANFLAPLEQETHPAIVFIRENARSYLTAYRILEQVGTPAVTALSQELYGHPGDRLPHYDRSYLDIASYFLNIAEQYNIGEQEEVLPYSAEEFCEILHDRAYDVVGSAAFKISFSVHPTITARASAGPDYVKIRADARFSDADVDQLLHHEVAIHTLTYINGRAQPILRSLGYSAPRTTATQEGLATFAEYINYSINITRLKRIALRIIAVDKALAGADLIDLFRFFKEHGQDTEEAYYSSMRIFRGGTPQGGIVFLKDVVYLRGLFEIEAFLKQALHRGNLREMDILYAGKLTTDDAYSLSPLVEEGYIAVPSHLPHWMQQRDVLAAHLAINDLTERFKVKGAPL